MNKYIITFMALLISNLGANDLILSDLKLRVLSIDHVDLAAMHHGELTDEMESCSSLLANGLDLDTDAIEEFFELAGESLDENLLLVLDQAREYLKLIIESEFGQQQLMKDEVYKGIRLVVHGGEVKIEYFDDEGVINTWSLMNSFAYSKVVNLSQVNHLLTPDLRDSLPMIISLNRETGDESNFVLSRPRIKAIPYTKITWEQFNRRGRLRFINSFRLLVGDYLNRGIFRDFRDYIDIESSSLSMRDDVLLMKALELQRPFFYANAFKDCFELYQRLKQRGATIEQMRPVRDIDGGLVRVIWHRFLDCVEKYGI